MPIHIPVQKLADSDTSDGFHTFDELYEYRMLYNALAFNLLYTLTRNNEWPDMNMQVHKSRYHSDGKPCFGGGWFIVMAKLPTGQISNHYPNKYWNLFDIEARSIAAKWDGHTPDDVADRIMEWLKP